MEAWIKGKYVRRFRNLPKERQAQILDMKHAMEWAGAWERFNGGAVPARLLDKPHVQDYLRLGPEQRAAVLEVLILCDAFVKR